jgi:pseudouridine-5'-phosphate glycosidase
MGTGGIGGVHRGDRLDISGDLGELARAEALVVCSGAKSFLDVPATMELLEALGVPVLGYRTDELPLFYSAHGGPVVSARVENPDEAAQVARTHWGLRRHSALVLAQPPPESLDVEPLVKEALAAAEGEGISGPGLSPYVLAFLHERSGGETLRVNRELVLANADLAAEVAVAYAG